MIYTGILASLITEGYDVRSSHNWGGNLSYNTNIAVLHPHEISWQEKGLLCRNCWNHALLARFLSRPAYFNLRSGLVGTWELAKSLLSGATSGHDRHCHCSPPHHPAGRPLVIVHGAESCEERLELAKCLTTSDRKVNIADPYNQVSRLPLSLLSSSCWPGACLTTWKIWRETWVGQRS